MKVDPEWPKVADALARQGTGDMARRADRLARTRAQDRAHASVARPLRFAGLADFRRRDLRRAGGSSAAIAGAQGHRAAFEIEPADRGRSARPAPHAGGAGCGSCGFVGGIGAGQPSVSAAVARDCAAQQIVKGSSIRHQPPEAMSIRAAIHHLTHYKYDRPVSLGPQIIRLRPAPHSRTRVISHSLKVSPANHFVNHQQDPYGNWLARYVFPELVNELKIEVDVVADMTVYNPFDFFVEESAETWPFEYPEDLRPDLVIYRTPEHAGPRLQAFLSGIDRTPRRTVDFVVDLNRRLAGEIQYLIRMESGVQTPEETFERGSGSCRDSSWLLVQIFRHLGLAARFVSGYLIQLKPDLVALDGPPGTDHDFTDLHAWAEVYLPGAGWIGLDPTSGLLTGGKPHSAGRDAALSQRRADFRPRKFRQCRFQFRHAGRSGLRTSAHHQAVFRGRLEGARRSRRGGRQEARRRRRPADHGRRADLRFDRRLSNRASGTRTRSARPSGRSPTG